VCGGELVGSVVGVGVGETVRFGRALAVVGVFVGVIEAGNSCVVGLPIADLGDAIGVVIREGGSAAVGEAFEGAAAGTAGPTWLSIIGQVFHFQFVVDSDGVFHFGLSTLEGHQACHGPETLPLKILLSQAPQP